MLSLSFQRVEESNAFRLCYNISRHNKSTEVFKVSDLLIGRYLKNLWRVGRGYATIKS